MDDVGDVDQAGKKDLQIPPTLAHVGHCVTDEDAKPVAVEIRVQQPQSVVGETGHGATVASFQEGHLDDEGLFELLMVQLADIHVAHLAPLGVPGAVSRHPEGALL